MKPIDIVENGTAALRRNLLLQQAVQDLETRVHMLTLELDAVRKERQEFLHESQRTEQEANALASQLNGANSRIARLETLLEQVEELITTRD